MKPLASRVAETEQRYSQRTSARRKRERNLKKLGAGGDWREVDDPDRVSRRITARDLASVLVEAVVETPAMDAAAIVLERIINDSQLISADFFLRGAMASRSVGKVVVRNAGGAALGSGTGFLVTPTLLMTNNHVLANLAEARPSTVQFDFVSRNGASPATVHEFGLDPERFFATDEALDFAIVAVHPTAKSGQPLAGRPWNPLHGGSGKALVGERINIIQHPAGRPQELSIRDNRVVDVFDLFLHYSSDTERGSSGAPAFNDQWSVAALHHSGVPKRDEAGRILTVSDEPWDGSDAQSPMIAWIANEGVRVSSIVEHLKDRAGSFTDEARALVDELFAAESPPLDDFEIAHPTRVDDSDRRIDTSTGIPGCLDADGRVHWTMPLQIWAALGVGPTTGPVRPDPRAQTPAPAATPAPQVGSVRPSDLADALARVAEAAGRTYFDETVNESEKQAFYGEVSPQAGKEKLFRVLSELLTRTHHTKVPYKRARLDHLYPWVDLQPPPALNLTSVYSGRSFSPEEIIRLEVEVEAKRGRNAA